MTEREIKELLDGHREYYRSGATIPVKARIACLRRLYETVKAREGEICEALRSDLGKSERHLCVRSGLLSPRYAI